MAIDNYDVIVCGDSFCCASDVDLKMVGLRAHFSQILEDRWNYRVLNLAHGGVSNTCILWQIREAARLAPKTIVYNRTFEGRVDLMLNERFATDRGLRNWGYWEKHMTSYDTPYTTHIDSLRPRPSVVSTVYQGLAENQYLNINQQQLDAVEAWLTHFFNWEMFREMNNWQFAYWHRQMLERNIQPLPFRHGRIGRVAWDFSEKNQDYDSPFHTDRATQEQIAENIHAFLQSGERLQDGWTE